jgi:DnaJ-class molecular chaperone
MIILSKDFILKAECIRFENIFSQMFGGGLFVSVNVDSTTTSFRTTINISLEQAYHGGEQILKLQYC